EHHNKFSLGKRFLRSESVVLITGNDSRTYKSLYVIHRVVRNFFRVGEINAASAVFEPISPYEEGSRLLPCKHSVGIGQKRSVILLNTGEYAGLIKRRYVVGKAVLGRNI